MTNNHHVGPDHPDFGILVVYQLDDLSRYHFDCDQLGYIDRASENDLRDYVYGHSVCHVKLHAHYDKNFELFD